MVRMSIELYSDVMVVIIKDAEGNPVDRYETEQATVKDLRKFTKAQVEAAAAVKNN